MELIIPFNLRGKDVWVTEPPYERKVDSPAKFHMDDELSQKDREWLLECGIPMVERATAKVAKKSSKKKEEKKETEEN